MRTSSWLAFTLAAAGCATVPAGPLPLAAHGQSDYVIVVPQAAAPAERRAAAELQSHLEQICGARLAVVDDAQPEARHEIRLGGARRPTLPTPANPEGFRMLTQGDDLLILGGSPRGTLYGAYAFLEEQLGCRWFAPGVTRIPKQSEIRLAPFDLAEAPRFEYREPQGVSGYDPDWSARNRVNSAFHVPFRPEHGGSVQYVPGYFVHTFDKLVPPKEYFAAHPEYYALVKGKRQATQLCLANPDVRQLALDKVRQELRAHPECSLISVSQNDGGGYCQCPGCQAIVGREGSQAGPILELVNFVAAGIATEFPDKAVDTLAYYYSEKAPQTIQPLPNVIVRLCSYGCCSSHPLASCPDEASKQFRANLFAWSRLTRRIWIWDYTVNYANFVQPFPNLQTLGPNLRFFAANGVRGVFEEGDYINSGSELQELRLYLLAKCLWNPEIDPQPVVDDFVNGTYGAAAPQLHQYLALLGEIGAQADVHVGLYDPPTADYLSPAFLDRARGIFDAAEQAAAGDPETLRRVRIARLPVDYVLLATWKPGGPMGAEEMATLASRFRDTAEAAGIKTLHEGQKTTPRQFTEKWLSEKLRIKN